MSALATTLAAFTFILVLVRLRVPLAAAIVVGSVTLGLALGLDAAALAGACVRGAVAPLSVGVIITVVLLLAISEAMRESGQTAGIVTGARALLRRPAVAMAALPALIGLLPMPGGALFSAPMVASAAGNGRAEGPFLSAVNYWFRHVWEYWWPLYPGVILAASLTHLEPAAFALQQAPLTVFMAAAGIVLFRGSHPELHRKAGPPEPGTARRLLRATSTIWVILVLWLAVRTLVAAAAPALPESPSTDTVQRFLPIALALLGSLSWTVFLGRLAPRTVLRILTRPSMLSMVALVVAVMVFQSVLTAADAAPRIAAEMRAHHLPVLAVVVLLPAIAGVITGVAFGFVGTSFPIVLPLLAATPGTGGLRPWIVLAYACGHFGMMLSPVHLCYVVSNRYFGTPFGPVYRHIAPAAGLTLAAAGGYVALLFLLGG